MIAQSTDHFLALMYLQTWLARWLNSFGLKVLSAPASFLAAALKA